MSYIPEMIRVSEGNVISEIIRETDRDFDILESEGSMNIGDEAVLSWLDQMPKW
jgi:hypothetical protein